MAKPAEEEVPDESDAIFADAITLLMAFFVMLLMSYTADICSF